MEDRTAAGAAFPKTRWSVVLNARRKDDPGAARSALAELCRTYWYPLYAFARRQGWTPEDAEDLTQTFFTRALETNLFNASEPSAGRLRTFLLTAFERDLLDARRDSRRLKRGGGQTAVSIDRDLAEDRFQREPALQTTPLADFDRQWAISVLSASVDRLASEYASGGKTRQFDTLRGFLGVENDPGGSYDEASSSLGLSKAGVRQAVHRMRERFRVVLRDEIADTLKEATDENIDHELDALRVALSGH
jgi:RNA polymerase sigma-70 factor (ECF subfamily)